MSTTKLIISDVSAISALGIGFDAIRQGLAKEAVVSMVKSWELHSLDEETPAFLVADFDPKDILGKKGLRTKDHVTKVLLATIELNLKQYLENESEENMPGLVVGTAFGSVQSIGDFLSESIINGVNSVNPMHFANTVINSPTGNANIRYGVKTLSTTVSTGFNAGMDALIYACDHIRRGYAPALIAGGVEEVSYYTTMGLERSKALSTSGTMMPLGVNADGIVTGEGCAMFFVETEENAKIKERTALVEIAGYASAFDPNNGSYGYNPGGEGLRYAIKQALSEAGIGAEAISFIASGANGSRSGSAMEAEILKDLFSDKPITCYKAKTGECYGASIALNIACAISDMKAGLLSATAYYEPIEGISLVSKTVQYHSEYALITAYTPDGNCCAMVLKNR